MEDTVEVTMEDAKVVRLLQAISGTMTRQELQSSLGLENDDYFRRAYLRPALQAGLIEMTIPDKPRSKYQRYRLTPKGRDSTHVRSERDDTMEVTMEDTVEDTMEDAKVVRLLQAISGTMTRQELQSSLGLENDDYFRKAYLLPALRAGLIEMTIPDKPRNKYQRYRLTPKGRDSTNVRSGHDATMEVTTEVTMEDTVEDTMEDAKVVRLLQAISGTMTRQELQSSLGLENDDYFRKAYLLPALQAGLIEMTIPDKPRSKYQRYRLTPKGREV